MCFRKIDIPLHIKECHVLMYELHFFNQVFNDKPNKVTKIPGGLNGAEDRFKRIMENKVAAKKLVYTMVETTKQ